MRLKNMQLDFCISNLELLSGTFESEPTEVLPVARGSMGDTFKASACGIGAFDPDRM